MTTLFALSTKDSLVMGCDSLGSVTRQLIDPFDLIAEYFNPKKKWNLKTDKNGKPLLKNFDDIWKKSQTVPFNHMPHVTKLFSLEPLKMGAMITGISSIGDRTVKSLINEFKTSDKIFSKQNKPTNYTVKSIAKRLLNFINPLFKKQYPEGKQKPALEFMIGGYDKQKHLPCVYRIKFNEDSADKQIDGSLVNTFGVAFGGQFQEIQRIVFGTDIQNRFKILLRSFQILNKYRDFLQDYLQKKGIKEELPQSDKFGDELLFFNNWDIDGFDANWGDFSEQNAIECVNFFVEIMIRTQQFSSSLPTVGGDVHIAIITKDKGFRFVSREEYEHKGYFTPIERQ